MRRTTSGPNPPRGLPGLALGLLLLATASAPAATADDSPELEALQQQIDELSARLAFLETQPVNIRIYEPQGMEPNACDVEEFLCRREIKVWTWEKAICYSGECENTVTWRVIGPNYCAGDVLTMRQKPGSMNCFDEGVYTIEDGLRRVTSNPPAESCNPGELGYPAWWLYSVTLTNSRCSSDVHSIDPLVIIDPARRY